MQLHQGLLTPPASLVHFTWFNSKRIVSLKLGLMTIPLHLRCSQGFVPYHHRLTTFSSAFRCNPLGLIKRMFPSPYQSSHDVPFCISVHPSRFRQKDVSTSTFSILAYSSGCRIHHPALWLLCCIIADPGLLTFHCLVSIKRIDSSPHLLLSASCLATELFILYVAYAARWLNPAFQATPFFFLQNEILRRGTVRLMSFSTGLDVPC